MDAVEGTAFVPRTGFAAESNDDELGIDEPRIDEPRIDDPT